MKKQIESKTVKEFNEKLDDLSKNSYPGLPPLNSGLMIIYEKLDKLEKKLEELSPETVAEES